MGVQEYFSTLNDKVNPDNLDGINAIINFDLDSSKNHIIVKDNKIVNGDGLADGAEVTITAKEKDLLSVISGDTNPMMAIMTGKLKITNPAAMMKYAKILGLM